MQIYSRDVNNNNGLDHDSPRTLVRDISAKGRKGACVRVFVEVT